MTKLGQGVEVRAHYPISFSSIFGTPLPNPTKKMKLKTTVLKI